MGFRKHLALIGYRASGKTSVAQLLAQKWVRPWVDVDAYIEEQEGCSIPDIFKNGGEEAFRSIETRYLTTLCSDQNQQIISTGGGAVLKSENRQILQANCLEICYLSAPASVLAERLRADAGDRPSLTGVAVADEVASVLEQRISLYEGLATQMIDATKPVEEIVQQILKIVEN